MPSSTKSLLLQTECSAVLFVQIALVAFLSCKLFLKLKKRQDEKENRYLSCSNLFSHYYMWYFVAHCSLQISSNLIPWMLIWVFQWELVSWTFCLVPWKCVEKMGDKIVPNFSFRSEQRPLTLAFLKSDICCFMLPHETLHWWNPAGVLKIKLRTEKF